jgi:hypothetical protein
VCPGRSVARAAGGASRIATAPVPTRWPRPPSARAPGMLTRLARWKRSRGAVRVPRAVEAPGGGGAPAGAPGGMGSPANVITSVNNSHNEVVAST